MRVAENSFFPVSLCQFLKQSNIDNAERYNSYLYSESEQSIKSIETKNAEYNAEEKLVDGREVLRDNFDAILGKYPSVVMFGEDAGKIGGVNQGLEGLQKKSER